MARNTNLNVAPGGGGGAGRGNAGVRVSSTVKVKPKVAKLGMSPKEVARLKAINAKKSDPNKSRTKSATKAANKDVVKKPLPKLSAFMGRTVTGAPKQVSKAKAAKIKSKSAPKPKSLDQLMAEFKNK